MPLLAITTVSRFPRIRALPRLLGAIRWQEGQFLVGEGLEDHAVMDVTWAGARAYALFFGKRLPTEAEWEKAARGSSDFRRFPWGNTLPSRYHANAASFYDNQTVPVGNFSPIGNSPYGVAELLGRFEWTGDWFGRFYYADNFSQVPVEDPKGPEWGIDHPIRGVGTFAALGDEEYLQPLAFRYQWAFEFGYGHLFADDETGFRTALSWPPRGSDRSGHNRGSWPPRVNQRAFPEPRRYASDY
jgi:formylglycine-generating enzyme required for sulfatase activity